MQASQDELALWQEALGTGPRAATGACPSAEEIWRANAGEASPERVRELVDHTLACSDCAVAWRLARQLVDDTGASVPTTMPGWRSWRSALAAVAAVAVLAVGLFWQQTSGPSNLRSGGKALITTPLAATSNELPREAFVLSWEGPQEGLRYDLWVAREDAEPVAEVQGIRSESRQVEYRIDAELLAGVPSGGTILWRVETTLPGRVHIASETFVVRVE